MLCVLDALEMFCDDDDDEDDDDDDDVIHGLYAGVCVLVWRSSRMRHLIHWMC